RRAKCSRSRKSTAHRSAAGSPDRYSARSGSPSSEASRTLASVSQRSVAFRGGARKATLMEDEGRAARAFHGDHFSDEHDVVAGHVPGGVAALEPCDATVD